MAISKIEYNGDYYINAEPYVIGGTSGTTYYVPLDYVDSYKALSGNSGLTIEGYNYNVKRVTQDVMFPTSGAINTSTGVTNFFLGQRFNTITLTKSLHCGGIYHINFMCLPFETSIGELKQVLNVEEISVSYKPYILTPIFKNNLQFYDGKFNYTDEVEDDYFIIKAGKPFVMSLGNTADTHTLQSYTMVFHNKTITALDGSEFPIAHPADKDTIDGWYMVGNIAKYKANYTQKATCSTPLGITSQGVGVLNTNANLGQCGAIIEYRNQFPIDAQDWVYGYSENAISITETGATLPTLTNPTNLSTTHSSSDESVATISNSGVVTIVGNGTTIISASTAGNNAYNAKDASYTLTVDI